MPDYFHQDSQVPEAKLLVLLLKCPWLSGLASTVYGTWSQEQSVEEGRRRAPFENWVVLSEMK